MFFRATWVETEDLHRRSSFLLPPCCRSSDPPAKPAGREDGGSRVISSHNGVTGWGSCDEPTT